jgi:large subunit ribosomal protein L30e
MVEKQDKNTNDNIGNKLKLVIKSGILSIGYNTTNKMIKEGKSKLIIIANNCPSTRRLELEYLAMLNKTTIRFKLSKWKPVQNTITRIATILFIQI